ncbi:MAG: hypothetical protein JNM96_04430, partial [Bacteroidia bacterium]|nr:hypothetical protein [Bacteroidia bacterium]
MDLKKGILLLLILLFVNNLFSQIWCYPGAEWYYNRPFFSGSGYTKHTYVGNVTFQSINCQKISYYSEGYNNFSQSIQTYSTTFYTYVSNNVVYHYFNDASTFDTLVNFNASIGDSWYTPYNSTCGYKKFKVLDTGHHVIQGQNLK